MREMIVDARTFSDAMSKASRALAKKCPIPILGEICVSVRNGICTLTGTDLETWLTARIPARGDDMDFVFYKTKDVMKICSRFDGNLVIRLSEIGPQKKKQFKLLLKCGQRAAEWDALDAEDYPLAVSVEDDNTFRTNAAQLLARIERVRYATENPNTSAKSLTTCVQFKGRRVYSLDGRRMACDTQEDLIFPAPFLCYGSSLAHLKIFGKNEIQVQVGTHRVLFTDGIYSLCVHRNGVETYDVDSAVPKHYLETITVGTAEFIEELSYLKECAVSTTAPYVRFEGENLTIATPNGIFHTGISLRGRGDLVIGFDLHYMLDALKQFKGEPEVQIKLSGTFSPIVIEAENRSDFALVLPVRLKAEIAA